MPQIVTTLQIPNYASAPATGLLKGQLYQNTTDNLIYYYNGTAWVSLVPSGGGGNVSNSGTPTVNQLAVWTDATHIQGVADTTKQWDGGATGLTAATGRTSLGLGTAAQSNVGAFEVPLSVANSIRRTTNTLDLLNDSASPGNNSHYMTNSAGTKGWYTFAVLPTSGILAPTAVVGTSNKAFGLGVSSARITPTVTGKVMLNLLGNVFTSVAGTGVFGLVYGTGTAPANGAITGLGTAAGSQLATSSTIESCSINVVLTGLTLNTLYWFDMVATGSGGTSSNNFTSVTVSAYELP